MTLCRTVLPFSTSLEFQSAVWIGLSIGGTIALRAALRAPERVTALVILDADAGAEGLARRLQFQAMSAATRVVGVRPFLPEVCRRMFGLSTRRENRALVAEWRERFAAADLASMRHCLAALNGRDSLLDQLQRIDVPALVIVGEEDVSLPLSRSQKIDAGLRNSEPKIVPGAGHLSALENQSRWPDSSPISCARSHSRHALELTGNVVLSGMSVIVPPRRHVTGWCDH